MLNGGLHASCSFYYTFFTITSPLIPINTVENVDETMYQIYCEDEIIIAL